MCLQELIRELGAILLQLGESFQLALRESLERLTIEASTLMGCMRQFNTALYKAALAGRLNEHHCPCEENLDSAWFDTLPVSTLHLVCCHCMPDFWLGRLLHGLSVQACPSGPHSSATSKQAGICMTAYAAASHVSVVSCTAARDI